MTSDAGTEVVLSSMAEKPAEARDIQADEGAAPPEDREMFVARIGVGLLVVPDDTSEDEADRIDEAIRDALTADDRVESLEIATKSPADNRSIWYFHGEPAGENSIDPELEAVLRLNSDLEFTIRVPIRTQPIYRGRSDVPSDVYRVHLDGVSLVVLWSQFDGRATLSGGHVVLDVLEDVVGRAGYKFRVQACSAGCTFRFLHVDLLTFGGDPPDSFHPHPHPILGEAVHTPWSTRYRRARYAPGRV